MDNPWTAFMAEHPIGTDVEGEVRGITEFGMFVGLGPELDGMVHINDISWEQSGEAALEGFNKGDMVKARVLDVDIDKERISLGIKQMDGDPMEGGEVKRGAIVTCVVSEITSGGIEVMVGEPPVKAFIRRSDLSRDRADQRPERFAVGDKVDARVTQVDRGSRRISLSIKALEIAEEQEAVAQYGSADAGASLGDILGAALGGSTPAAEDAAPAQEAPKKEEKAETPAAAKADASAMDDKGRLSGPQGDADDLKKISGVGPAFEKKLNGAGIYHFWQLAELKADQVEALEEELNMSGRMERDEWVKQAKEFMG